MTYENLIALRAYSGDNRARFSAKTMQEVAEIEYAVQAKAGAGILQQLTQGECRHAD